MAASTTPSSILIVGSGVFGLSTAYSLSQHADYREMRITLVDRSSFPARDGSSIDSSRIVRGDYTDVSYTQLAGDAQSRWRNTWWGEGIYHEDGLAIAVNRPPDSPAGLAEWKSRARAFMNESLQNQKQVGLKEGPDGDVQCFEDRAPFGALFKQPDGSTGADNPAFECDVGYINRRSGWVDAEGAMRKLREKVNATGRVEFVTGQVKCLIFAPSSEGGGTSVRGVTLASGTELTADVTFLATGAWTPSLLDMRGVASATGQVLAYMDITDAEQEALGHNPTILSTSSGMFIITPSNNILKVARHGYGYANRTAIPNPEAPDGKDSKITVSLPLTTWDEEQLEPHDPAAQHTAALSASNLSVAAEKAIPLEAREAMRSFLRGTYPVLAERPFASTRICWYLDTASSHFILDWHPRFAGLFVATGGSGHAFKFAPVIGDCALARLRGEPVGHGLDEKWGWPARAASADADGHVWCEDIRGGRKGMELRDEFAKG